MERLFLFEAIYSGAPFARRVLWYGASGLLFILTWVFTYLRVSFSLLGWLLLILAGIASFLLGFVRYHPTSDALVLFIISLLVFGLFTSRGFTSTSTGGQTYSFMQSKYPGAKALSLSTSDIGRIQVLFTDDPLLIVNLTFGQQLGSSPFFGAPGSPPITNFTDPRTGLLTIVSDSTAASLDVIIGAFKVTSLNVTTSTGNISINATSNPKLNQLKSETSDGSISISLNTSSLINLQARTVNGNIDIAANYTSLASNGTLVARSGVGHIFLRLTVNSSLGCTLQASTVYAPIAPSLTGFIILANFDSLLKARSQNYSTAPRSLSAILSTDTGTIVITAKD